MNNICHHLPIYEVGCFMEVSQTFSAVFVAWEVLVVIHNPHSKGLTIRFRNASPRGLEVVLPDRANANAPGGRAMQSCWSVGLSESNPNVHQSSVPISPPRSKPTQSTCKSSNPSGSRSWHG